MATTIDWDDITDRILRATNVQAELEGLGVRFAGNRPSPEGWLPCHAFDREDKSPSAAVNVASNNGVLGRYKDLGGTGLSLNLFELMVLLGKGRWANWREVRAYLAEKAGIELPNVAPSFDEQVEWRPWNPNTARLWCRYYKLGVTLVALESAGARMCCWPASIWMPYTCIALPALGADGEPRGWAIYRTDGCDFPYYEPTNLRQRKCHNLRGGGEGWIIVAPGSGNGIDALKAANVVWCVEGPTDALALHALLPTGTVAISNATGANANPFGLPLSLLADKTVYVTGDADKAGVKRVKNFAPAIAATGANVWAVTLPYEVVDQHGRDVRDWVNDGHGTADLVAMAAGGEKVEADPNQTERTKIIISTSEHVVADAAIVAIAKDGTIYRRGTLLVSVVRDKAKSSSIVRPLNTPRIAPLPLPLIRERLAANVEWIKVKETKEGPVEIPSHPPAWAVQAIAARGQWDNIRPLEGIVQTPVLRADGSILSVPGYDSSTGLLYEPEEIFPAIPEHPTQNDAILAVQQLEKVVEDFPFGEGYHRAAWVAGILTPLARFAYRGPTPLFLVDANTPGTGKGLLCDTIGIIVTGRPMSRMPYPGDDDELRKNITATALAGDRIVLIDNIATTFGSPALDALLTATTWRDRILGKSETTGDIPLSTVWYATGNNIILVGDVSRRICHVRLSTILESPEERNDFHQADLLAWVQRERTRLVAAALTVLRAYVVAGKPCQSLPAWGSYPEWSALVRSAIVWAGMEDPAITRRELAKQSDRDGNVLASLLAGWAEIDPGGKGVTVSAALKILEDTPHAYSTLRNAIGEIGGKTLNPRSIGMKFHWMRDRVIGGRKLERRSKDNTAHWYVVVVDQQTGDKGSKGTIRISG